MNIDKITSITLSAAEIVRSLQDSSYPVQLDIQALPENGAGVKVEAVGNGSAVRLTYVRKGVQVNG